MQKLELRAAPVNSTTTKLGGFSLGKLWCGLWGHGPLFKRATAGEIFVECQNCGWRSSGIAA